jgi:hypothetical protein
MKTALEPWRKSLARWTKKARTREILPLVDMKSSLGTFKTDSIQLTVSWQNMAASPKTTVTFSLRIPVVGSETEPSIQLDELLRTWRETKGVTNVAIEWKSRRTAGPNRASTAYVDAKVEIEGNTAKQLQRLYNKLTRVANKEPGRLASRTCNLNELFE